MKKTALVFLIFVILISFSLKAYSLIGAVDSLDPVEKLIEIEKGMTGSSIALKLKEKKIIKSAKAFYLLLRLQGVNDLQAGYYRFSTSENLLEIIEKLQQGNEEKFNITIPEGFTLNEILERFESLSLANYDGEILEAEINKAALELNLENDDAFNSVDIKTAEGLIIPTTYNFPMSFREKDIALNLINYFKTKRLSLLKKAAVDSDYTPYQLLIIASLIEEEGKLEKENKIIASVIYNRLNSKMPLQLDATVQYALAQRTERVLYKDLEIDSPYNTYKIKQLPPTPIASPGDKALEAAIEPIESDYLFYFALPDGSHIFTKNYQNHLQKQRELLN